MFYLIKYKYPAHPAAPQRIWGDDPADPVLFFKFMKIKMLGLYK